MMAGLKHLLRAQTETLLLIGWLALGALVTLFTEGWIGLGLGLVNMLLVGIYAIVIRWMTPDPPSPMEVKRPVSELVLALILLVLFLLTQLLHFGVWRVQPFYGWIGGFFQGVYRALASVPAIPSWALQDVFLAVSSSIKQLVPTLLAFWLCGYRCRDMGFAHPHWKLTAMLAGVTTAFGIITGVLTRAPPAQVLGLYGIGILVNALPEELFFRGLLLPRLERVLDSPSNALILSTLLFNALHVPIEIVHGTSSLIALLGVLGISYPSGLMWGYLYLRTRSIVPGIFWHAANGNLGFLMMDM
jgi:membrane protease YdiL (CAAX protease family)